MFSITKDNNTKTNNFSRVPRTNLNGAQSLFGQPVIKKRNAHNAFFAQVKTQNV